MVSLIFYPAFSISSIDYIIRVVLITNDLKLNIPELLVTVGKISFVFPLVIILSINILRPRIPFAAFDIAL